MGLVDIDNLPFVLFESFGVDFSLVMSSSEIHFKGECFVLSDFAR